MERSQAANRTGIDVTDDAVIAIACFSQHQIRIYDGHDSSFACLDVIGKHGKELGQFNVPQRLCFAPANTLLVCDHNNNRVQHMTMFGAVISHFTVRMPVAVAVHSGASGGLVAVSVEVGPLEIHRFPTFEVPSLLLSDFDTFSVQCCIFVVS